MWRGGDGELGSVWRRRWDGMALDGTLIRLRCMDLAEVLRFLFFEWDMADRSETVASRFLSRNRIGVTGVLDCIGSNGRMID